GHSHNILLLLLILLLIILLILIFLLIILRFSFGFPGYTIANPPHPTPRCRQDLLSRRSRSQRSPWRVARHRSRRVRRALRPVGFRQIDFDEHARLPRSADVGELSARQPRNRHALRQRAGSGSQSANWLRVSELQSAGSHQCAGERGVAALVFARLERP